MINLRALLDLYKKNYWNRYWKKTNIYYKARPDWLNGYTISMILKLDSAKSEEEMKEFFLDITQDLDLKTNDKKAIWAFNYIRHNKTYLGDFKNTKSYEYWYTPFEAFKDKEGDCEDEAILMYKICRILGVPAWRLKLRASKVKHAGKLAGHCYLCYLTRANYSFSDEWYSLDWCYMPTTSLRNFKNKPIRKVEMYNPFEQNDSNNSFKWSFNEEFEWSQRNWDLTYKKNLVEEGDLEI